jgi:hypothetical protein
MAVNTIEEAIVSGLRELPVDKQREVLDFVGFLSSRQRRPLKSLEGLWEGQGVDISEEDIAEIRREMWEKFPRGIE